MGLSALTLATIVVPARADIVRNLGVDLDPSLFGGQIVTTLPFYDGDFFGVGVNVLTPSRTVTINTAAVFGPAANPNLQLVGATLWVDAEDVSFFENIRVFANGVDLGELQSVLLLAPVPLQTGGYTLSLLESDNTVFTLPAALLQDLANDTTFQVEFRRVGGGLFGNDAFIDGFNIQGHFVPEPTALALLGLGSLCALGYARRRSSQAA
jgi:hypothetical protein